MKLALPLGLLGLLAIAALILIYILKPKYQDKKVASTYVWKLSLRYQKRKVPLQWLKSSVLLIVQILVIAAVAFMMAQPYAVLATKNGEKIVVLDASASMLAEHNGKTRFERAKSEISALADVTADSDKFTVIIADEEASFIVRRSDSLSYIKQKLFDAQCSFTDANIDGAMDLAKEVLAENPNADIYLYTDCDYENAGKVNVVNMSDSEWNAAILNFTAERQRGLGYVFTAEIASYFKEAEIAVSLNVNGKQQLPKLAVCAENQTVKLVWDTLMITEFTSADIHLTADDAFPYDNDFYIYSQNTARFKVQLVSEDYGFLFSALHAVEKCQVDLFIPSEYESETEDGEERPRPSASGYDLYIYDNAFPDEIPTDGALWLINPTAEYAEKAGISISGKQKGSFTLSAAGSNSETVRTIMDGVSLASAKIVTEYSRVEQYAGFESVIQCGNDPVLLAKTENGAKKTVVLALDIHMSDLPLWPYFPIFINNLCNFSMSYTLDGTLFKAGENVEINGKANTESITVETKYTAGNGAEAVYTSFPLVLEEVLPGVYNITQVLSTGRTVTESFYVRISDGESVFGKTEAKLVNPAVSSLAYADSTVANDTRDISVFIAAVLLALLCIEWGLQYREQY